jgi:hypothetical protein
MLQDGEQQLCCSMEMHSQQALWEHGGQQRQLHSIAVSRCCAPQQAFCQDLVKRSHLPTLLLLIAGHAP